MTLDEVKMLAAYVAAMSSSNHARDLAAWVAAVAPHLEHLLRVSQTTGGDIEERLSTLDAAIEALRAAVEAS